MNGQGIKIRDEQTGTEFLVPATEDRHWIKTKDGESIKVYPYSIKTFIAVGNTFEGHTRRGTRQLVRVT